MGGAKKGMEEEVRKRDGGERGMGWEMVIVVVVAEKNRRGFSPFIIYKL